MNSRTASLGTVFISYAHLDQNRVEPIVKYLADKGFAIWWDRDLVPGTSFRTGIQNALDEASCVLVFWSHESVQRDFVRSEASNGQERGVLVPVLLDSDPKIPVGFTELQYVDLANWGGADNEAMKSLVKRIRALVALGPSKDRYQPTISNSPYYFDQSQNNVTQLRNLTSGIRSISHLLTMDYAPIEDLKGALGEVNKTYNVVNSSIVQFTAPAIGTGPIDPKPFLEIGGGTLQTEIRNGHGHCSLILTYYGKFGGIRDWIQDKLSPEDLQQTDNLFAQLGTADGDLFRPLEEIGEILTNESRVILNLLAAEQEDIARKRIRAGRVKLTPLRDDLSTAMQELQDLERSLGYAGSS